MIWLGRLGMWFNRKKASSGGGGGSFLLMETASHILKETGDSLLLE